jgi:signal transduction histidine kinase
MELELTDLDLPMAIENALMLIRERAGRRGIALHTAVDERLGQVRADERKVRQVVLTSCRTPSSSRRKAGGLK